MIDKLPLPIRNCVSMFFIFLSIFTILRILFFFIFISEMSQLSFSNIVKSFFIGLRFDTRLVAIIIIPYFVLSPFFRITKKYFNKFWKLYWMMIFIITLILYISDIGYYSYLNSRLDASMIGLMKNIFISTSMIWESYPIIPITFIIFLLSLFFYKIINKYQKYNEVILYNFSKRISAYIGCLLIIFGLGYGKISRYPLRWSDAFHSTSHSANQLAINPVLYFVNTITRVSETYEINKVKKYYPIISSFLNVKDTNITKLNFSRKYQPNLPNLTNPNIVIIILETLPVFKCGILGNPLNPTPNFDKIAKNSILFPNYYVPKLSTAASIYCTLTGLPDMAIINKSSTRDPFAIKQDMLINQLQNHNKYFFIGGSANWGDLNGFLKNNIKDIKIYEEGSYDISETNSWGISDYHLLQEANKVLSSEPDPFISIILTAGHHRPYTIPNDINGFEKIGYTPKHKEYSFGEDDFYAFKFMDFALGEFINTAKKEDYFKNTLFVIYGDHGSYGYHLGKTHGDLTTHEYNVPLLFYGPGLNIKPNLNNKVISEIDIFPSIFYLLDIPYENKSLGRNIFSNENTGLAFLFSSSSQRYGLISDSVYIIHTSDDNYNVFYPPNNSVPLQEDNINNKMKSLSSISQGIFETSRYLRYTDSKVKNAK